MGRALLDELMPLPQPIRLMGLTLSGLETDNAKPEQADGQLSLL
jgi:DNA polymerase-4